jgi:hypothetical protein
MPPFILLLRLGGTRDTVDRDACAEPAEGSSVANQIQNQNFIFALNKNYFL